MTPPADRARPWRCPQDDTCPSQRGHDTVRAYNDGCRSRVATTLAVRYKDERTRHRVPAVGTARRLQALATLGWVDQHTGARLHVHGRRMHHLRTQLYPQVWNETADAVAELYLELSETEGPSRLGAKKAINRGHQPPEAWDGLDIDDPTAVPWTGRARLAALGDPLALAALEAHTTTWDRLTRADHDLVVDELRGRGRTHNDIATHLDLHPDVVRSAWERVTRRHQRAVRRRQADDRAGAA